MAITQVITSIAPAANPATMDRNTFSTTAAANVLGIVNMTTELNTWASQVNAIASTAVGDVATAIGAATADTPVGTDELCWRKTATGLLKKVTFTNALTWFGGVGSRVKIQGASRRKSIENSDGLGSSANVFNIPQQQAEITGTRTSGTVFTRSAGTWVASALVGQYAFSYATGAGNTGVWLPITANTTTTVTVNGTLHATGTALLTCPWNPIAATYAHGQGASAFQGSVFDGENVWLVPYSSANLVKVNPATGVMTAYAHGQGATAFGGGVFDGENVWLIPYSSANLLKVNPATGAMTAYAHGQGATAFQGGVFDGESIWLIPNSSANLVKVNPATGAMTAYAHGYAAGAFSAGVFDGESIWLTPFSAANLVKVNPATGAMTAYAHGQGASAFIGGSFDGENLWLAPFNSTNVLKVTPSTGAMVTYAHGQGTNAFAGSVFDGESVWLIPYSSTNIVKVNPLTGTMTAYAHGQGATPFIGGVFDGESIWLTPFTTSSLVRCIPPRTGRRALNVTGTANLGGPTVLGAGTTTSAPLTFTAGTDLATPAAGVMEYDGRVFHSTPVASNRGVAVSEHYAALSGNFTGANVNTAQPVFNASANGTITLPAATSYQFEGVYAISTTGTTSHSLGLLFGGTATITSIGYEADVSQNATSLATLTAPNKLWIAAATNTTVTAAVATATYNVIRVRGIVRINAAGTFIPQFQYSAAPGVAPTISANSLFRMWAIGTNTDVTAGNWS